MNKIKQAERQFLDKTFGARVNYRRVELKLYGHDIAALPGLVKPLVGNTVPDAIVQPVSEDELVTLVKWAARNGIPLTPRGKATTGYGGVLSLKGGLAVDFYYMKNVKNIDKANLTATVEPGIVFEKLDARLKEAGLTLKSYPSSYPAGTLGGWLAQGGAGIGSFEFGWFRESVIAARLVTASGEVKVMSGEDLDMVNDACGISGFISEITLKVQPDEELEVASLGSPNGQKLQELIEQLMQKNVPVWSLLFINPRMAEFRNLAPLMEHYGQPVEEKVEIPKLYITTVAYRKSDSPRVQSMLQEISEATQSVRLPQKIAEHEWENRFRIMIIKRLGPSLVPAEVVVPLKNLGIFILELEKLVNQPLVKEGIAIKKGRDGSPEVVILGFIPSDQRRFKYNFVFGLSLTVMSIAEQCGGRAYSTGLYYANKADKVLGRERLKALQEFKRTHDPEGIMNPGKVLGHGLFSKFMGLAGSLEPVIRVFGNNVITEIGERPFKAVKDIPADVAWYAYACSQCGYCVDECDQYYGRGWESQSPRGKWYWLREYMEGREKWDQFMVDAIIACTTCELCNHRCSASLPIEQSWLKLRAD
jgi:FAD/FMN-containing dehydrogenase/ferredoxin